MRWTIANYKKYLPPNILQLISASYWARDDRAAAAAAATDGRSNSAKSRNELRRREAEIRA